MEKLQRGMQAQPISGAIPELVQLLQRAALATEAEGRVGLAHALRWWAEQLEPLAKSEDPRRPEMWIG